MQRFDLHAVHFVAGNADAAGDQGGVFRREVNFRVFFAAERDDGTLMLGTCDDAELVPTVHHGVGRGTRNLAVVENSRADEGAADEVADFTQRQVVERLVDDGDVKVDRRFRAHFLRFFPECFFVLEINAVSVPQNQYDENDAENGNGVGTGVAHGNVPFVAHEGQRFLRRTQAGGTRDGTEMHAQQLRQRD